jgi:Ca-activated chloride channel homolog
MRHQVYTPRIVRSTVLLLGTLILLCAVFCLSKPESLAASDTNVACRVEMDRSVLAADGPQKVVVKVTLDPARSSLPGRPPVNLALVLDRSGSMAGEKLEKTKEAAIAALRRLGPQDILSLVIYDHEVVTLVPAGHVQDLKGVEERIRGIRQGGRTALFAAVSQGAAELRKNPSKNFVHRILLLSDGIANVGPSAPEDLGRLGAALIKEGISVTTIGVGTDYHEDLMTRLSQNSDGNTYFVESAKDLTRIFNAELGDVLNVVAKKVKVTIEFQDGVKPLNIIGREGRIRERTAELYLNQLYGGQEKYVLIEAEVPRSAAGREVNVASAVVSYENPLNNANETASGRVQARFSEKRDEVERSLNPAVQKDYELNLNVAAQERAIALADKGKTREATEELRDSARRMMDRGNKLKDEELVRKANQAERQAGEMEKEGMTQQARKKLRTDSYQMKNQQRLGQ